jgi:ABC-type uncharacterized transport system fused permease/ATPase subunit
MAIFSSIYNRVKDYQTMIAVSFKAYRPYFTFQDENKWQWIISGVLLVSNILQALVLGTINTGITSFFTSLSTTTISNQLIIQAMFDFIKPALLYGGAILTTAFLRGKLIKELNSLTETKLGKKWLSSNISYGKNFTLKHDQIKKIPTKEEKETEAEEDNINFSDFFSHDIPKANGLFVNSLDDFMNRFLNFIIGGYYLWQYSTILTIPLGSISLIIPGSLITGAIVYSIFYSFGTSWIGRNLFSISKDNKQNTSEFNKFTNHMETNAEQTALLNSKEKEQRNFLALAEKSVVNESAINNLQSYLASFALLGNFLNMIISVLLSIPQIIAKKIQESELWSISANFSQTVGFLNYPADKYADLTELKVISNRMINMQDKIALWENTISEKEKKLHVIRNKQTFSFKNLTIKGAENCDLLLMNLLPTKEEIGKLTTKSNKAYLFVQDKLYYLDKTNKTYNRINISSQKCNQLKKELVPNNIADKHYVESLTENKLLLISKYTRHQHNNHILKQVNLTFKKGNKYLITGKNGIGKSTLFRTLAGIWPFCSGEITFNCEEKDICILPQNGFIPLHATLYDAVAYPNNCKNDKDKARILALLKALKFDEDNKHLSNAETIKDWNILSNGQKQKVAITRAIIHQPKILLMDEPFSSLSSESMSDAKHVLTKHLPKDTIVLCIDHQPKQSLGNKKETQFYQEHLIFENKTLHPQIKHTKPILPTYQAKQREKLKQRDSDRTKNHKSAIGNTRRKRALSLTTPKRKLAVSRRVV